MSHGELIKMNQSFSRRSFLKIAGLATSVAVIPRRFLFASSPVKVGAISYSFRQIPGSAEEILGYMQTLGLNTVELMGGPAEQYAGAPDPGPGPRHPQSMTQEERSNYVAARTAAQQETKKWRRSAPMEKFAELGDMFRDGGVDVDILKLGNPNWFAEDIDYAYRAAKAIGARGISFEISARSSKIMAPFATKHGLINGMHNHLQVANEDFDFDEYLSHSPNNMLNLDIGHYVAALGTSPIPVIKKYHDRISHLHLKDRKTPENGQDNVAWGTGDTPIGEVLRLLRDENYPIPAMIELEHPIPEGSSVMEEMAKCVDYCREALES